MILFSSPQYDYYASKLRKLPGWQRGLFSVSRYQNRELFIQVKTTVQGETCAILAETAPPDESLLSLLLLAHTLKKEGAKEIIAIIPYLGYSRHDRQETGRDLATLWLGESLQMSGVTEVVTIDAHSTIDSELFPIPIRSLSPAKVLAKALHPFPPDTTTIVAPDVGAIDNCENVRNALGKNVAIVHCEKKRSRGRVSSLLNGKVQGHAVLVDDMIDTGRTLLECLKRLRSAGVRSSIVLVSHGVCSGSEWRKLLSRGVEHIYCTDTIPHARHLVSEKITVLPAVSVLVDYFKHASYGERG